ncbi:type II secretion system F family protein [Aliidiomarina indica]|uniref:type II secretion system F family protein n=1 Tax=Aliidiomarina indica TaxID=2749147 RepID=UPI0018904600|nr:type II secretion system F family protein [Aliidiomarina indica]
MNWVPVKLQQQLEFLHDLHEWLHAGNTPEQGLVGFQRVLEIAARRHELQWLKSIRRALQQGQPMGSGLQACFRPEVITLLNLGQRYGCLASMLDGFKANYELRQGIYKGLLQQLAYPLILLLVSCLACIFIGLQVIPRFVDAGAMSTDEAIGGLPQLVHYLAMVLNVLLPILVMALVLATVCLWHGLPRWRSPLRFAMDDHLPFRIYRQMQTIWLMQNLAMFLKANLSVHASVRQLISAASPYTQHHLKEMRRRLSHGEPDMMKVLNTGLVDSHVWVRLQCQDQNTPLSQRLQGAAVFAQRDLKQLVTRRQRALAWVCYSISGLLILGIFASMGMMFAEFSNL